MKKNKFILKSGVAIIVGILIFVLQEMYSSPRFGHVGGMITKNGDTAHAGLLGLNEDNYVIYVSGIAKSPFESIKIVLEGEPEIDYNIKSQNPPTIDLGYHKFYEFENNIIRNISADERYNLLVSIKPKVRINKESMYYLKFYDLVSDSTVLTIPILFKELINFHIFSKIKRPEINVDKNKKGDCKNKPHSSKKCCKK